LENHRKNKKTGWQNSNPFSKEIVNDRKIRNYLKKRYQMEFKNVKVRPSVLSREGN
jgi:hypothetical protein